MLVPFAFRCYAALSPMSSHRFWLVGLLGLLPLGLLHLGCNSSNPVEPPPPSGGGSSFTVTLTSPVRSVTAGSTAGTTITVRVVRTSDGSAPPNGTSVSINVNLGDFGVDSRGNAIQLTSADLVAGQAQVTYFPGAMTGTATILAQVGDSAGSLSLSVVAPGTPPTAAFSFETSGLSALFTDSSSGDPNSWAWNFGDGSTSGARNPLHTYAAAGSYVVTLVVGNSAGQSNARKFVMVEPTPNTLRADFASTTNGLEAIFTDSSTGSPTAWSWSFGDGSTSTQQNPRHTYAAAGTFTVSLGITNALGQSASASKFVTVAPVGSAPRAAFTTMVSNLSVIFTDTSTGSPTAWSWDFGDGNSSTQQNPTHVYAAAGSYQVRLTATNLLGSSVATQFVTVPPGGTRPSANFTFETNVLQVSFTDTSTGSPTSWSWNFGDNTAASTAQNPVHTYASAGTYTVTLTATNVLGSSTVSKFVAVSGELTADFSYVTNGQTVVFTSLATGAPTSFEWDFGDGGTSTLENPSHTYTNTTATPYTVTFTVRKGSDSALKRKTITVPDAGCTFSPCR
jgi:PKD repeat protein